MQPRLKQLRSGMDPLPEGKLLAGVSGGADSTALLILLKDEARTRPLHIEAVHVNHGIRGEESDRDEEFVREVCRSEGIPLHVYRVDLKGKRDENSAREARYRCFRECMRETASDYLVLAHHRDDLAETFLMRLLRGAGPEGLGCMRYAENRDGIRILRPMLRIGRDEIRGVLEDAGISWREDSSNEDGTYLRNDVRKRLIPLMEEMSPGASGRIARAARLTASDNDALDMEAERFLAANSGERWLDWRPLESCPDALKARILRRWWRINAPEMDERGLNAEQTERLVALAVSGGKDVNLPGGLHAERGPMALHLTGFPEAPADETPVESGVTRFGAFRLEETSSGDDPGDGRKTQQVPRELLQGCVIRFRKPGDRITPFGMNETRKLQDYLTDRKIDAPWRGRIPLLCRGNEVLWAAGVGTGNIPGFEKQSDSVRLTWYGDMPWYRLRQQGKEER